MVNLTKIRTVIIHKGQVLIKNNFRVYLSQLQEKFFSDVIREVKNYYEILFACDRMCAISGTISSFVPRVTAGVEPGMQKIALP